MPTTTRYACVRREYLFADTPRPPEISAHYRRIMWMPIRVTRSPIRKMPTTSWTYPTGENHDDGILGVQIEAKRGNGQPLNIWQASTYSKTLITSVLNIDPGDGYTAMPGDAGDVWLRYAMTGCATTETVALDPDRFSSWME